MSFLFVEGVLQCQKLLWQIVKHFQETGKEVTLVFIPINPVLCGVGGGGASNSEFLKNIKIVGLQGGAPQKSVYLTYSKVSK